MLKFIAIALLACILPACGKPTKDLSSYTSAARWIKSEYKAETMRPDSSTIHKVEYYSSSPEKWLLVYFKSNKGKGYIYKSFPVHKWDAWTSAPSKGKWYHRNLKGNHAYFFKPRK